MTTCNVLFCVLEPHEGRHMDVTGYTWDEAVPDEPVIARVYTWDD